MDTDRSMVSSVHKGAISAASGTGGSMKEPTGQLSLVFRKKASGKTYIAQQYFKLPLQIMNHHYQDEDGTAFVYLLNPSGGILQHDRLLTELTLEEGSRAFITTPSNTKFYKMDEGHAEVVNRAEVKKGAVLEYLPEHNVPFAGSNVYQENVFHLDRGAVLIASDMVTAGRLSRGERFEYQLYDSRTKIYVDGKLRLYDCSRMEPEKISMEATGIMEGYQANGSIYVYAQDLSSCLAEEVNKLSCGKGIRFAAGCLDPDLMIVRFLGEDLLELKSMIFTVWDALRRELLGKHAVRIRKY